MKKIAIIAFIAFIGAVSCNTSGPTTGQRVDFVKKLQKRAVSLLGTIQDSLSLGMLIREFSAIGQLDVDVDGNELMSVSSKDEFALLIIVPSTQAAVDYLNQKCGTSPMCTQNRHYNGDRVPAIYLNPYYTDQLLSQGKDIGCDFDYLASCLVHEAVHVLQRLIAKHRGIEIDDLASVYEREFWAYSYQGKLLPYLLQANRVDMVLKPAFIPKDKDSFVSYVQELEVRNPDLGLLANLFATSEYPELAAK